MHHGQTPSPKMKPTICFALTAEVVYAHKRVRLRSEEREMEGDPSQHALVIRQSTAT